jgi:hypothetical protein
MVQREQDDRGADPQARRARRDGRRRDQGRRQEAHAILVVLAEEHGAARFGKLSLGDDLVDQRSRCSPCGGLAIEL